LSVAFLLPSLLERAEANSAASLAVADQAESLTYRELADTAAKVAAVLRRLGVRPGDTVAVRAPKSVRIVGCFYGIMQAGAAYVPIDPLAPPERANYIIRDSGATALVTTSASWFELQPELGTGVAQLLIDDGAPGTGWAIVKKATPDSPHLGTESDLAYILYTSGSTGRPKGVMITHRNALTFVDWCVAKFGPRSEDRFASHAPFHFDLSIHDLYVACSVGASVHLLPAEEAYFPASVDTFIRDRGITIWYSVPTALIRLVQYLIGRAESDPYPHLRLLHFAGEVYPIKEVGRLRSMMPRARLFNLYGPTETNVCTYYEVLGPELEGRSSLPIGRACENQNVFAVADDGHLAGEGEEGELWVRGPGVMGGYLNLAEETAGRLVPNRFARHLPELAYRTGDIVVPTASGDYEFRGRRDHQVKLRGYRIELGEIEATVTSHPGVSEAAAVVFPSDMVEAQLHLFCLPANGTVTSEELRAWCRKRLPPYMTPEYVHVLETFPRTSTGKIDRGALAQQLLVGV
jgi:amino acid adenylation domain-containing protein